MEVLVSAVIGEIVSRTISVVIEKCREQMTAKE
jgi:hypothetical protein